MANNRSSTLLWLLGIVGAALVALGGWLVFRQIAGWQFALFTCSYPEYGNCQVASTIYQQIASTAVPILLGVALLAPLIIRRHWLQYAALILSAGVVYAAYPLALICTSECGFAAPNDQGGCPVVQVCHVNPSWYAIWLLPLAVLVYIILRRIIVLSYRLAKQKG